MATQVEMKGSQKATLEHLNQEYAEAFMNSDIEWYRQHLADDFVCIESDGSLVHKQEFLTNVGRRGREEAWTTTWTRCPAE